MILYIGDKYYGEIAEKIQAYNRLTGNIQIINPKDYEIYRIDPRLVAKIIIGEKTIFIHHLKTENKFFTEKNTFVKINKIITELMCNTKKVMKMKADILKIKVKKGYNQIFKQYCKENKIYYKSYPEPIINTYMAECSRDKLFSIYCYISTIENIPMVTMC